MGFTYSKENRNFPSFLVSIGFHHFLFMNFPRSVFFALSFFNPTHMVPCVVPYVVPYHDTKFCLAKTGRFFCNCESENLEKKYFKNSSFDISATKRYFAFKLSLTCLYEQFIYVSGRNHIVQTLSHIELCWITIWCEKTKKEKKRKK